MKKYRVFMKQLELFTIARIWKQPRCPSIDEWIKKLWYIYTMGYYWAIKRNALESVLMRWMNPESIIQRCIYTESRKMILKNLFSGQQWRNRHRE